MWKAEERIRSLAYTGSEDDLVAKMNKLGPEEYLNCFLVTKGVRDGYLYQTVDHNEYDVNAPISKKKFVPSFIIKLTLSYHLTVENV